MQVVFFPFEVEEELEGGAKGCYGASFDGHSDKAADEEVGP